MPLKQRGGPAGRVATTPLAGLERRLEAGLRLGREEALRLLRDYPLGRLMRHAHTARMRRHPAPEVTFVFDTNPNYTNVCTTRCSFCAFWRSPRSRERYTLEPEELAARVERAWRAGATTVLLQGGHNPEVRWRHWQAYLRAIRARCPTIHIHPFSPPEIAYLAEQEGVPAGEILRRLRAEGIRTLPGGGAELLGDRVRREIAPEKCDGATWLGVMEQAHRLGFRTTATLMYGHVEREEEVVDHLLRLRELQDRTGGFSSFIPWSFKPGNSPLGKRVRREASPLRYLRILALARLVLDNFPHVQSSWFSEDLVTGQLGLLAGADDFGGLLFEENVLRATGHDPETSLQRVGRAIREMGFEPVQRDSLYRRIHRFPRPRAGAVPA